MTVNRFVLYLVDDETLIQLYAVSSIEEQDILMQVDGTGFYAASSQGYSIWALNYTMHGMNLIWVAEFTANNASYKLSSNESEIDFNADFKGI